MFCKNVGKVDRILRIVVGIALLSLAFVGPKTAWGYIGIVPILTAFLSFCPMYTLFKLNTCCDKDACGSRHSGSHRDKEEE